MQRWIAHYGEATARAIAVAHTRRSRRSISPSSAIPRHGRRRSGPRARHRHGARRSPSGPIPQLAGYDDGEWWVQDAAAALPARLLRRRARGKSVADLCAAPGGKTAQLALAGAHVTAVDRSAPRLERLRAKSRAAAARAPRSSRPTPRQWQGGPFDAMLIDAPCSSTGTIRRHPDIPWLKSEADLAKLAALQTRLLDRAVDPAQAGRHAGLLHLLAGSRRRARTRSRRCSPAIPRLRRSPIPADELAGHGELLTPEGDLRTLPCHLAMTRTPGWPGSTASMRLESRETTCAA